MELTYSYFNTQALYQFSARALGMGRPSSQRHQITSGSSSEASDPHHIARTQVTDPLAMDIKPAENLMVIPGIHLKVPVLLILYVTGYTNVCDILKYFSFDAGINCGFHGSPFIPINSRKIPFI